LPSRLQPCEDRPRRSLPLLPLKPYREVPALKSPHLFLGAGFGQNQIQTLPHRCIGWVEPQRRFEARAGAIQIVAAVGDLPQQLEREELRGIRLERSLEQGFSLALVSPVEMRGAKSLQHGSFAGLETVRLFEGVHGLIRLSAL